MREDISFYMRDGRFQYRAGAIIRRDNHMLLVRNRGSSYYYTVGGRVKYGETAQETVLREAYEETGVSMKIERLVFIHENFFVEETSEEPFHEICLFFLMRENELPERTQFIRTSFQEEYTDAALCWLPMDQLDQFAIHPEFLATALPRMDEGIKHFVTGKK
ncbi:MAG: NUDIX hydrolase [Christensenellales bacterium]